MKYLKKLFCRILFLVLIVVALLYACLVVPMVLHFILTGKTAFDWFDDLGIRVIEWHDSC